MSNIVRVVHDRDHPYVVLNRENITENDSLSYGARGLLAYLLSKPDDWEVRMTNLVNSSTDGRQRVRSLFKELNEAGFVERTRSHDKKTGQWNWETVVYETPHGEPEDSEPEVEAHDTAAQGREPTDGNGGDKGSSHSPCNQEPCNQLPNKEEEEPPPSAWRAIQQAGVILTQNNHERWKAAVVEQTDDLELIEACLQEAKERGKLKVPEYVGGIIRNCKQQGRSPGDNYSNSSDAGEEIAMTMRDFSQ